MTTYFSPNAMVSMQASGYRNTTYALAELIDNSFDGEATKIKIVFFEKRDHNNKRYIDEVIVTDNGNGMTKEVLYTCLRFGSTTNTDLKTLVRTKKKGKFGFGLPNASLSQCRNITAYSWQTPDNIFSTKLNLDEIVQTDSISLPEVQSASLPPRYKEASAILDKKHGTIISWMACDKLSAVKGDTLCDRAKSKLGTIYRHLLHEGATLSLEVYEYNSAKNSYMQQLVTQVVPNDPLFLMKDTLIAEKMYPLAISALPYAESYKQFSTGTNTCKATNIKMDDLCQSIDFRWGGTTRTIEITASVAHINIQKPGIKIGASTDVGQFYGQRDSISFVRAGREIASGDFGFYRKTEPQHRWWSIEVKFDADCDDLLGVFNTKQGITFEYTDDDVDFDEITSNLPTAQQRLWVLLSNKLQSVYTVVWKTVRDQGRDWDALQNPPFPGTDPIGIGGSTPNTEIATVKTDGKRPNPFKDDQKQKLAERLAEKFPLVPIEQINKAIVRFDEARLRACVLYHASEDPSLWTMTSVYGFLITLINKNHFFYRNIMLPLRELNLDQALTAIELFISSLAVEENSEHFMQPERKHTVEEFRSLVGIHLNRYIRDNSIELSSTESLEPIIEVDPA